MQRLLLCIQFHAHRSDLKSQAGDGISVSSPDVKLEAKQLEVKYMDRNEAVNRFQAAMRWLVKHEGHALVTETAQLISDEAERIVLNVLLSRRGIKAELAECDRDNHLEYFK